MRENEESGGAAGAGAGAGAGGSVSRLSVGGAETQIPEVTIANVVLLWKQELPYFLPCDFLFSADFVSRIN